MTIRLTQVECVAPSAGIHVGFLRSLRGFFTEGAVEQTINVATSERLIEVIFVPMRLSIDVAKVFGDSSPKSRSADDFYVKVGGKKRWPTDKKHHPMKAGSKVDLDLVVDGDLELMEWDHVSDDSLGKVPLAEIVPGRESCLVASEAEGSLYRLYFTIT